MNDNPPAPGPRVRLSRSFWVLWSGSLLNRLGYLVQPFLALYLSTRLGVSSGTVGVVLACFGAGAVVSQPLGGWLADQHGPRRTLIWGMVGSAGTVALIPFAGSLASVAGCVTLYGVAVDVYRPALAALVVRLVPDRERVRAFGLIFWAVNLGSAMAGMAGGVLAARGYWLLFAIDAVTCLAFALVVTRLIPPDRAHRPTARTGRAALPWRDGLLWGITGTFLVFAVLLVQAYVTLPLVMRQQGLSTTAYGLVIAVNPLLILVAQPLLAPRIGGLPRHLVYVAAMVLTGAGFGMTGLVRSAPGYALAVLVWSLGEIGVASVAPALVTEIAAPDQAGRYSGLFGAAYGASSLIGPLIGTSLLEHAGAATLWAACAGAGLGAAVVMLALGPATVRRTAAVAAGG